MTKLIIDGSNLRSGGGVTHIIEILNNIPDETRYFDEVIIFSNTNTLKQIHDRNWLIKKTDKRLNKGLLHITYWKKTFLKKFLEDSKKNNQCLLFSPPGTYTGGFTPYVGMSRNMLIFDTKESNRYGFSWIKFKFWLLRMEQTRSFEKASDIIFISNYAKKTIQTFLRKDISNAPIINHGVNQKFNSLPKKQCSINEYSKENPFELLYISPITVYKHQINLLKAVKKLYSDGFPIRLNLVGGNYKPYHNKYLKVFNSDNIYEKIVKYHGKVSYQTIENFYKTSNGFVFASTCENMPNILIEAMSSGLPILCSNYQPMPEFLGKDYDFYFDPTDVDDVYEKLKFFLEHPLKREQNAYFAHQNVEKYSWEKCANETFHTLFKTLENFNNAKQ